MCWSCVMNRTEEDGDDISKARPRANSGAASPQLPRATMAISCMRRLAYADVHRQ
jgi:hypothetical protein